MACACKVSQQLSYLQKKYGTDTPGDKKTNITVKVKIFFEKVLNGIIVILLSPVMLISILSSGGVIRIDKKFGLARK